jgi:hypothetical protein
MGLYVYDNNCNQIGIQLGAQMTSRGSLNGFNLDSELKYVIIVFLPAPTNPPQIEYAGTNYGMGYTDVSCWNGGPLIWEPFYKLACYTAFDCSK